VNRDGISEAIHDQNVGFEPSGYYRKRNWFRDTWSLILIGEKQERPPLTKIYRDALNWALNVVRTPVTYRDHHNGLAAYTAWTEDLIRDEDFTTDNMEILCDCYTIHNNTVSIVAEGRWYAAQFLKQIAEYDHTMVDELLLAAECYEAECNLMWQIWNLGGYEAENSLMWYDSRIVGMRDLSSERVQMMIGKLSDGKIRRQIIPLLLAARDRDSEAADHIERALKKNN
jgi:hypothetical protein